MERSLIPTFRCQESARSMKLCLKTYSYREPGLDEKEINRAVTLGDGNSELRFVELGIFEHKSPETVEKKKIAFPDAEDERLSS